MVRGRPGGLEREGALGRTHEVAGITSSRLRSHVTFGRHVDAGVREPRV